LKPKPSTNTWAFLSLGFGILIAAVLAAGIGLILKCRKRELRSKKVRALIEEAERLIAAGLDGETVAAGRL